VRQYLEVLREVIDRGVDRADRTGTGTRALFGLQMRFRMSDGFPIVTTKRVSFETVKAELLWFISGSSDVNDLRKLGARIWDANADADYWKPKARFDGDVGRIYGVQWRHWRAPDGREIDQRAEAIRLIRDEPYSRRIVVTAWNPGELGEMALPPCHALFQFFVAGDRLSLQLYQRSCDLFLGVPFNISSYALLLHAVAQVSGLVADEFVHTLGDAHIYHSHLEQVREQLSREPLPLPRLELDPTLRDIDALTMSSARLVGYAHHAAIRAKMAV
jgi:thymidylate synthase